MKERITISVEPEVLQIAKDEVEAGRSPNVSAAFERAITAEKRRRALREALELLEAEHGPIGEEAMEWADREIKKALKRRSSSTPER